MKILLVYHTLVIDIFYGLPDQFVFAYNLEELLGKSWCIDAFTLEGSKAEHIIQFDNEDMLSIPLTSFRYSFTK